MTKVIVTRVICWVVTAIAAIYVLEASVGTNIVQLPGQASLSQVVTKLLPQGWAFFTKPADSEVIAVFDVGGAAPADITVAANADPQWVFGLNRSSRYQGFEAANLLTSIGESSWTQCDQSMSDQDCIAALPASKAVVNNAIQKTICGEVALVAEAVTPWAYRHLVPVALAPVEAIRLDVSCG